MTFKPQIPGTVLCFAHSQFLVFYYYCFGFAASEIQTYVSLFCFNCSTAQHMIVLIKDSSLARRHGTLRFVKLCQQCSVRLRIQRTRKRYPSGALQLSLPVNPGRGFSHLSKRCTGVYAGSSFKTRSRLIKRRVLWQNEQPL